MAIVNPKGIRILVIDDDDQIRMLLNSFLSMKGYSVDTYSDGIYALEDENLGDYDVVISDLNMPQVDGLTVLTHTKSIDPDIVCIIVSGMATLDSAIKALRTGIDDYIVKPFDINQLEMVIERNLRTTRLKRENEELQKAIIHERDQLKRSNTELQLINNMILNLESKYNFSQALASLGEDFSMMMEFDGYFFFDVVRSEVTVYNEKSLSPDLKEWIEGDIRKFFSQYAPDELSAEMCIVFSETDPDQEYRPLDSFCFPFRSQEKMVGLIGFFSDKENVFQSVEKEFLTGLSTRAQIILDRIDQIVEKQKYLFATMLDHMQDVVILIDMDKNVINANLPARQYLEIKTFESDFDILKHYFKDDWDLIFKTCYEDGRSYRKKYTIGEDNDKMVFDAVIDRFTDPPFIDRGFILSARDITSDQKVEELKADLISNVSHELKTPIAIIKEYVSLLDDELAGPMTAMQHKFTDIMNSNLERLAALIANFLNISKLDAGGIVITIKNENINRLVEKIVEPFFVRFRTKNMTLKLEIQENMPVFQTDADVVQQVMVNLLENAFKYSPNDTDVILAVEINEADNLYFYVKDHGRGIAKKDQNKVFDRFFRTGLEMERLPGTGLGLSIVKQLIEELGGKIWLESTLGKGSVFYVEIPPNALPEPVKYDEE